MTIDLKGARASGRPDGVLALFAHYADELAASRRRVLAGLPRGDGMDALRELLQGGKMARALVVHLAGDAAGGGPVGPAADAVELLHAASLVHDDIIDGADRRRGRPALHVQVGTDRALVLGDWAMLEALRRLSAAPGVPVAAVDLLLRRAQECCVGEDAELAADPVSVDDTRYVEIAREKAGSQFAAAAGLGVLLAGGDARQLRAAETFGEILGIAYQVRDDVLDLYGDPAQLGKPTANSPLVAALAASGVIDRASAEQDRRVADAVEQLEAFPPSPAVEGLRALARFAVERTW